MVREMFGYAKVSRDFLIVLVIAASSKHDPVVSESLSQSTGMVQDVSDVFLRGRVALIVA